MQHNRTAVIECPSCHRTGKMSSESADGIVSRYSTLELETCEFCEGELCGDCFALHECDGHTPTAFQCLSCGQIYPIGDARELEDITACPGCEQQISKGGAAADAIQPAAPGLTKEVA